MMGIFLETKYFIIIKSKQELSWNGMNTPITLLCHRKHR